MLKIILLSIVLLSSSCAHRMTAPLPGLKTTSDQQRVKEFEKYHIKTQGHKDMLLGHIRMNGVKYRLDSSKYLFDYINPKIYPRLSNASWGKYLAYLSLVPFYFFIKNAAEGDTGLGNISLSLLSATGFFYGLAVEKEKNNKLINQYNKELKIKLNIINLPL